MAEIHGPLSFKLLEPGLDVLSFSGQLKTKDRTDAEPYLIPTILPAELVMGGVQRLAELGKTGYTPTEVNRKLSKALSSDLGLDLNQLKKQWGIDLYKDLRAV